MIEHSKIVTLENGPRPAGKPNRCFYCAQPIGSEHKADCVCRVKVVMVKVEMTIPRVVPISWDRGMVDFHLEGSSWCADNIVGDLQRYLDAKGDEAPCMCHQFTGEYIREATADDLRGVDLMKLSGG